MMLDAKATFDELVARHAPDDETRDRILGNRIYQQLSSAAGRLTGVHGDGEALRARTGGRYDLLVLDTPPSRNALDFLDAPQRLTKFIEGRACRCSCSPPASRQGRRPRLLDGLRRPKRVTGAT